MNVKHIAAGLAAAASAAAAGNLLATAGIRMTGAGITKKLGRRGIALTFDDGPHPLYTASLLDLLEESGVRATFFVVGEKAEAYPWLVRRMHEDGHEVGIHHYKHVSNWRLAPHRLREELEATDRVIRMSAGVRPLLYRPPWGRLSPFTLAVAKDYETVIWSHILGDWKIQNCFDLSERLETIPADGSIVVLHDDGSNPGADEAAPAFMIGELEKYLDSALRKGTPFVTVSGRDPDGH